MPQETAHRTSPAVLGGPALCPDGPPPWPPDDPELLQHLQQVVADRSWGRYHGPHCERLTERLRDYHDCRHVLLCSSGTAAVELALRGAGVGPGDEVVLAAYDFKGNFQDVLALGATPVLVDVDAASGCLNANKLAAALTERTRAVIASHLHGGVVPMPELTALAKERGIRVIEDACQMPGASIEGKRAGMWGDVGVHSFGGSKLLSAGRGGALITDDASLAQRIRLHVRRGNDAYPLSEFQAAAVLPQLDRLDERNAIRGRTAGRLRDLLSDCPGLTAFDSASVDAAPGYYKFGFWYDPDAFVGLSREAFARAMRAEGIALDPGFRALHRIHSRRRYRAATELPGADRADRSVLVLHHPVLLEGARAAERIIEAVEKIRAFADDVRRHLEAGR